MRFPWTSWTEPSARALGRGWELVNNNWMYSAKYARSAGAHPQLGRKAANEIRFRQPRAFGYIAPGFEIAIERFWFHWSDKWNPNCRQSVEAKQGSPGPDGDAVASERPLEMLSKNKFAIGIAALMHVKDYPNLKVLKIVPRSGGAAVALTPDNVANRSYPLIRDAYFYVNKAPGKPLDRRAARVHALCPQPRGPGNHGPRRLLLSAQGRLSKGTAQEAGLIRVVGDRAAILPMGSVATFRIVFVLGLVAGAAGLRVGASEAPAPSTSRRRWLRSLPPFQPAPAPTAGVIRLWGHGVSRGPSCACSLRAGPGLRALSP